MANLQDARSQPRKLLWSEIANVPAVMLMIDGISDHPQPMAPLIDRDNEEILFYTRKSSDLVRHVGIGVRGKITIVGKQHDFHASIDGALTQVAEPGLIDKFWNPVVAAWYGGGKSDPDLAMLRFDPLEAMLWASSSSTLSFGWEIVKANLTSSNPDVGVKCHVAF